MRRKGFFALQLLALIIVLLIGALVLFLVRFNPAQPAVINDSNNSTIHSPKATPTTPPSLKTKIFENGDFNTYKNPAYGIEFTYPSEWVIDDHNGPTVFDSQKDYVAYQISVDNKGTGLSTSPGGTCPATYASILMHVGNSRKLPTLEEDIDLRLTQGLGTRDMWGDIVPSTFNNYESLTLIDRPKGSGCINTTTHYIEQDDNYFADVSISISNSTTTTDKQLLNTMVKSVKISAPQY